MNHFKQEPRSGTAKRELHARLAKPILFHAEASDPDMLYFSRFQAFDPYLAFTADGRRVAVINAGEYGRMAKESAFDQILLLEDVREAAAKRFGLPKGARPEIHQMVLHLAELHGIPTFRVGSRFPVGLACKLRDAGMILEIAEDNGLFPERQIKTAAEVEALRKGNKASEAGLRIVSKTLAESEIRGGKLYHGGTVLTAERLRALIGHAVLDAGAVALHTIAAPGDQAVDNHCAGYGPLRAGELIVVDIFPRRVEDGYWGDMTRTFLKGRASDAQRRLVRTVKQAHQLAIDMIKPGVTGGKVHDAVQAFFDKEGYETKRNCKQPVGFFHALGHGVGLEIHEEPIMRSKSPFKFRKGMVITVEPGLYYPGLGGCRIEDVVHVVPGGCELISSAPYKWEIP
jgi:Xaa-Pro aminopeptidase